MAVIDILTLEPGYELDALVAEHVMGIDLAGNKLHLPIRGVGCEHYSTDDATAWDMLKQRFAVNHFVEVRMYGGTFECAIDCDEINKDTLAHAASLAALLAVLGDGDAQT